MKLLAVTVLIMLVAACSPAPTDCVNGHDGLGRGPFRDLKVDCGVIGSGQLFCDAKVYETGYCAGPIVSITSSARWISTDPSVVALTTPGRFLVRKAGMSVIYAESDTLYSRNAYGYRTDVAGSLQQIGVVDVMVWQVTTGGFLPLATIDFTPEMGASQSCQLGAGAPYAPCRFWSDFTPAVVRVSKPGYRSAEQSIVPEMKADLSLTNYLFFRL